MKRKKIMQISIMAIAFYLTLAFTQIAFASAAETFEVQISINGVQNLYGFDLKLLYNTENLDLIEAIPEPPWSGNVIMKNEVNENLGTYRIASVALAPSPAFDGSTSVVRLIFARTNEGEENFALDEVALADQSGGAIPFAINGLVVQAIPVHDVAIEKISSFPRGVYQGENIYVSVLVKNRGNFMETFDVTLYADKEKAVMGDEYVIGVQTVADLPGKTSRTINFIWDTDGVVYGYYWLSAEATIVPDEFDTSNNLLKYGDWIGGIYAPLRIRQNSNLQVNLISTFMIATVALAGTLGIKNYWFQ